MAVHLSRYRNFHANMFGPCVIFIIILLDQPLGNIVILFFEPPDPLLDSRKGSDQKRRRLF